MKRTKQMPKSFNITFFNEDNSSNKEVSMLRLKSELMQNIIFLNEHSFTKKDLMFICQQYKIKVSAQQMKDAIINVLVKGILDSVSLHSHEEETPIDGEQPGPIGINPLSTPEPLSPTNTDSTTPVPEKRKRKQTISKVNGKGKEKGKKRQQMIMMKTVPSATSIYMYGGRGLDMLQFVFPLVPSTVCKLRG